MTYYFDMDGTLADFHGAYTSHADACRYDFIRNLAPFTANVATVRKAIAEGHKCYILSKAANEDAKAAKIDWLAEFIPEMDAANIIVIVGYGKKYEHMVEEGILVDDNVKETRQWEKAGHKAILLADKGATFTL
jgi:5'(3')-deoxyribonucleotidase